MASGLTKSSFAAGELAPALWGRIDLAKYAIGTSTMRNFFCNYKGGASTRAGTAFVGQCKQTPPNPPPRDIRFQFNLNQGYVLEFGEKYMRVKSDGAYVIEGAVAITGASQTNPVVINVSGTPYANGDWVYFQNVGGMTQLNLQTYIVDNAASGHFSITDLFGNSVNGAQFDAYTSGGTVARIFTLTTPWAAIDLPWLKFTQSADVMTLCCVNQTTMTEYPPYDLARITASNWTLTQTTFSASIAAPQNPSVVAQPSATLSTYYSYVITAVDATTGEESVASVNADVQNNDIALFSGTNTISWSPVVGAGSYNVYKATPSYGQPVPVGTLYGFMASVLGTSTVDQNITPDFTQVPPTHTNPFARGSITNVIPTAPGINYSPSTISYVVTSATGTGFLGRPIVVSGGLQGFLIINQGEGYLPGDTIAFSDSGGGVATGYIANSANLSDGDKQFWNGQQITFKTVVTPSVGDVHIENTLPLTMQSLANYLNASTDVSLSVATYVAASDRVIATYKTPGTVGNAYTLSGGLPSGATLTGGGTVGSGATANLIVGAESGTYPGGAAYFQQRRYYFYTLNQPDTYFGSKPGIYTNMDASIPVTAGDALTGTPWAQQINGIQAMVPMPGGNIILTGNGAWQLSGGGATSAVTPENQVATPQAYNGCNATVPPIPIDFDVLYVQSKGAIVRDLTYNFFVNIYTGNDKTELSSHLFTGHQIVQWAYAEEPYKIVWAIRDDGILLSMTYLKSEDIYGWARHDTNGQYVSVCSVTEPPVDATYFIVKRYIAKANNGNGAWVYYSERMDNRLWDNAEEAWCVDCGLAYPQTFPNATLSPQAANGTMNITSVYVVDPGNSQNVPGYTSIDSGPILDPYSDMESGTYVNPIVIAIDPTEKGSGATFSATVENGYITAITVVTPGANYSPETYLEITDVVGTGAKAVPIITNYVTFIADGAVFSADDVGDIIRVDGGSGEVVQYINPTTVIVNILQPLITIIPNDPNFTPVPAVSGSWSISTPTTIVSGLGHLNGMTVSILADGGVVPPQVVTNGAITLPVAASQIVVGLPYICQLQTLYLDIPGANPTVQGRRKTMQGLTIRTDASKGLYVGVNEPDSSAHPGVIAEIWPDMIPVQEMTPLVLTGQPIPLITGDTYTHLPSDWSARGQMAFQVSDPVPVNINLLVPEISMGDDPGP